MADTGQISSVNLDLTRTVTIRPTDTVAVVDSVLLQNFSPYLVQVSIAGDTIALGPYIANQFPIGNSGAPVGLTASNPDGADTTLPAYVAYQFVGPGNDLQDADSSAYPGTLNPPALAIAVATATKLLASGVPNVITETLLYDGTLQSNTVSGPQSFTPLIDTTRFASLTVILSVPSGSSLPAATVERVQMTQFQNSLTSDVNYRSFVRGPEVLQGTVNDQATFRVSCDGDTAQFQNITAAGSIRLTVIGTSHVPTNRTIDNLGSATAAQRWTAATQIYAAGTQKALARQDGPATSSGGEADLYAVMGSAGTVTASQIQMIDANGNATPICDSNEVGSYTSGTGFKVITKRAFVLPGSQFRFDALTVPAAATTFAPILRLVFRP